MKLRTKYALYSTLTALSLMLISGPLALAAGGEEFDPQDEFKLEPWIELKLGPIDLSINKAVFYLFLAAAFTIFLFVFVARKMQERPGRLQVAIEALYEMVSDRIVGDNIDQKKVADRWFFFIATLFLFIWFSNLIGYMPLPLNTEHKVDLFGLDVPSFALYAATANISVPLVLTLMVWFGYHIEGIKAKGLIGYFKSWMPPGVSGPVVLFVAPIEVLSQFVRLISLSVRLFANILAGHLLILLMGGGLAVILGIAIVGVVTLPVAVAFLLFEIVLVATLQAFIFATLSAIYVGGATSESH